MTSLDIDRKGCCAESGCRRKQPVLVRPTAFMNRWVIITRWHRDKDRPETIVSDVRHDIDDQVRAAFRYQYEQIGWVGFTGSYYPLNTNLATIHAGEKGGYFPVYRERDHE